MAAVAAGGGAALPRAWVVDPSLVTRSGHHLTVALAVVEEAARRGLPTTVLANRRRDADLPVPVPCRAVFTHTLYDSVFDSPDAVELADFALLNWAFADELGEALSAVVAADDVVIFPALRQHQLLGLAEWLERLPRPLPVVLVALMSGPGFVPEHLRHTPAGETRLAEDAYRVGFRRLAEVHPGGVRYLAETQPLADVVARLGAWPVEVCALVSAGEHFVEPGPRDEAEAILVVYLGSAREEKGFHLVPAIVSETLRSEVPVRFAVQAWLDLETPLLTSARADLRRLAATDARVTVYEEPLSREAFFALQRDADVILLPYDRRHYDDRGSGIFQEAIAHGKPMVVPEGSNPGVIVAREGNGVLFGEFSAASVAGAVIAAVRDFAGLRQVALDARERLRAKGIGPVLDRVLDSTAT